jgi:hypothetical protein
MSAKKSFSDFKKRILDILEANGRGEMKTEQVRLWRCEKKSDLLKSFDSIGKNGDAMDVDTAGGNDNQDDDVEENSGVEFPGESLEPYVGSSLTFDDVEFNNEVVLIELASPNFAYKYKDMGRV